MKLNYPKPVSILSWGYITWEHHVLEIVYEKLTRLLRRRGRGYPSLVNTHRRASLVAM